MQEGSQWIDKTSAPVVGRGAKVHNNVYYQQDYRGIKISGHPADVLKLIKGLEDISNEKLQSLIGNNQFQQLSQLIGEKAHITGKINIVYESTGLEIHLEPASQAKQKKLVPYFSDSMPAKNDDFTGRKQQLNEAQEKLKSNEGKFFILSFSGPKGMGKTQLARQLFENALDSNDSKMPLYDCIVWINASKELIDNDFETTLQSLINDKNMSQRTKIKESYCCLSRKYSRILIIFDNIEKESHFEQYNPQVNQGLSLFLNLKDTFFHFVITTTEENLDEHIKIKVTKFPKTDAITYIRKKLKNAEQYDQAEFESLVRDLGCFPLALTQATAYINVMQEKSINYSIKSYQDDLRKGPFPELFSLSISDNENYKDTVITTWIISTEKAKAEDYQVEELLQICAYLHPDCISLLLLQKIMFKDSNNSTSPRITALINILLKYELVGRLENSVQNQGNMQGIKIHRLSQRAARYFLERKDAIKIYHLIPLSFSLNTYQLAILDKIIEGIINDFSENSLKDNNYIEHIQTLLSFLVSVKGDFFADRMWKYFCLTSGWVLYSMILASIDVDNASPISVSGLAKALPKLAFQVFYYYYSNLMDASNFKLFDRFIVKFIWGLFDFVGSYMLTRTDFLYSVVNQSFSITYFRLLCNALIVLIMHLTPNCMYSVLSISGMFKYRRFHELYLKVLKTCPDDYKLSDNDIVDESVNYFSKFYSIYSILSESGKENLIEILEAIEKWAKFFSKNYVDRAEEYYKVITFIINKRKQEIKATKGNKNFLFSQIIIFSSFSFFRRQFNDESGELHKLDAILERCNSALETLSPSEEKHKESQEMSLQFPLEQKVNLKEEREQSKFNYARFKIVEEAKLSDKSIDYSSYVDASEEKYSDDKLKEKDVDMLQVKKLKFS